MPENFFIPLLDECPPETAWASFIVGDVDASTLESLSSHLQNCHGCLELIEQLSDAAGRLHDPISPSPYLKERNCQHLLELLLSPASETDGGGQVSFLQHGKTDRGLPEKIGRFVVRGVLGSGGFGQVYLADDSLLKRSVAIKAPKRVQLGSEFDVSNFLNEARHAAALDHPGIVPIYDVIEDDSGIALIVMKYIEGQSLAELLRERQLSKAQAVQLMVQIARAVHAAHEQGFVHRDLKPSNILIDKEGLPYVTDFGLGLNLRKVESGGIISGGTPPYMSPEQVRKEVEAIDCRSDVWSLGVMLAELVHGQRPFRQRDRQSLYQSILTEEPSLSITPDTAELDAIIRTCLAKSPSQRYATAEELAYTLSRWHQRHFPMGIWKWRFGWRRNVAVACLAVLFICVIGVTQGLMSRFALLSSLKQFEAAPADQILSRIIGLKAAGATPEFIDSYGRSKNESGRLRFSLARLALGDDSDTPVGLLADSLQSASWQEVSAVVDVLREANAAQGLGQELSLRLKTRDVEVALPAAAAFAGLSPEDTVWAELKTRVAKLLTGLDERGRDSWYPLFDSVGKSQLADPLKQTMTSTNSLYGEQINATRALAHFFENDIPYLSVLVQEADPDEIPVVVESLRRNRDKSVTELKSIFDEQFPAERIKPRAEESPPTVVDLQLTRLAVALWLLDEPSAAFHAFGYTEDPTMQTLVVHGLVKQKVTPKSVLQLLMEFKGNSDERFVAIRFAVLQILSLLDRAAFETELPVRLMNELWNGDNDCGVHSMVGLVAKRLGIELKSEPSKGDKKGWRTDSIGKYSQDFVVIEPCVAEVGIQDPSQAKLLTSPWTRHKRAFPRRVAIATTELTIQQFRELDQEYWPDDYMLKESSPDAAMMMVPSIDIAYRYCNRLSEQYGFETCYEAQTVEGDARFVPKVNHLDLSGYRLPTDAEWEMACRAMTHTSRYFGNVPELAPLYGWFAENQKQARRSKSDALLSQRVGQFLPNRWGLFDMYGNAKEICDMSNQPTLSDEAVVDEIVPHDEDFRRVSPLMRGCSLVDKASVYATSHSRTNRIVVSSDRTIGFRLARTILISEANLDGRGR